MNIVATEMQKMAASTPIEYMYSTLDYCTPFYSSLLIFHSQEATGETCGEQ
jgi:hypothetical protein